VQSNCVSIVPVETELGRKRAIDQSSCNKDFSCLKGFCPSFVTLQGAKVKKAATATLDLPQLPDPVLPAIAGTHNVVITGVGGTGVVTVGAVLAMAAHLDGKAAGMMEMAGLAQKGGAVHIHLRLAERPQDINAIRVAMGEADCVIGGDLVVTAGAKTLGLMRQGRTGAVVNGHEIITGEFTRNREFRLPSGQMRLALEARLKDRVAFFDATELAAKLLGDAIYSNMLVLGAAWQSGLVPVSAEAMRAAIEMNGAAVKGNLAAFEIGRWAAAEPEAAAKVTEADDPKPLSLQEKIDFRAARLEAYQNRAYADRFRRLVVEAPEALREAVAAGYHHLLAYKDEYEVARLHLDSAAKAREEFEGDFRMTFHLAPPLLGGKGPDGRPRKREFGPWMLGLFRLLAGMKRLRGTPLDPFGWLPERRMERALIAEYEADMAEVLPLFTPATESAVRALAELPLQIRGFGPVKEAAVARAAKRRHELLAVIRAGGAPLSAAAE
jgi:indolepyruvate ferredoxin oxidoreductase